MIATAAHSGKQHTAACSNAQCTTAHNAAAPAHSNKQQLQTKAKTATLNKTLTSATIHLIAVYVV